MRKSTLAMVVALGSIDGLPALAQQQTVPNPQMQQTQEEADKGVKTRQSGESGYVGMEEKPGASTHPPGRADTAPPTQTTGEASRDPAAKEMNAKEKGKVERMGK
jgi:hypothetical protein